jgi:pimeloyl-ACP methyl ester carboxylesterase
MAISRELGMERDAALPGGRIRYRDRGEGPVVLLVHGLLVNGDLWRAVVPALVDAGLRCITPDLPLGSHELAMPDTELTPPGVAALLAQLLDQLDVRDVTVVGNDTGGAITQILMTSYPDRIGRVVLTPSDAFEKFFPPLFAYMPTMARIPGAVWTLVQTMRLKPLQRLPIAFGWVTKRRVPPRIVESYLVPSRRDPAIRADLTRFLRSVHRKHTLAAAERFATFPKPVLVAWATEDRVFPLSLGRRLADALPKSTFVQIDDSYTFVPEDQPAALAEHIVTFIHSSA